MANVYDWFEERLDLQEIADDITTKYVPPHVNIFYCLGGITLVCFLIQFATGFAMTFYYKPTVAEAFSSVEYIMNDSPLVSQHDGINDDSPHIPRLSNRWLQKAP
jgi:cytochrome b6